MIKDIQIGDKIGPIAYESDLNFEVIGMIEGGMGIVYIGLLKKYGTIIAIKTFKEEYINYDNANEQFKMEALAWINLEIHPNIVNAMLFDVIEDRPFIFIELIVPDERNRNNLEHYLSSELSNAQILEWGIQFCYGMNHAFHHHVSPHRDIKPANIMITRDKLLKITDFGLAKIWENQELKTKKVQSSRHELTLFENENGTMMSGTYEWMAPESFSGQADIRSDIYSFGVVLYQMINKGKLPFIGNNHLEWKKAHKNHEIPHSDSIIFPIIKKCLAKVPDYRYGDFDELKKDLEELYIKETGKIPYKPANTFELSKGIHLSKGYGYEKLGRDSDALRIYEEAKNMDSDLFVDMINLGAAYNRLKQPKKAIEEYEKAVQKEPNSFLAHYNLGNALSYDGQIKDAIIEYDESIRLNPDCKECHTNYGNLLRGLSQVDEAIEHYNIVLKLDSNFFQAKVNLGVALGLNEKFDEAIQTFQEAENINPNSTYLYLQWGILLSNLGDYGGAIFKYIKALSLEPKSFEAHLLMGISLSNKGNLENAIHEFREAVDAEPENYVACRHLARALQQSGEMDESLEFYDKSININPNYEVSWLQKGVLLATLERFDEAKNCYDQALKIKSKYTVAWVNKGNLYGNLEEYEKAINCFDQALEIDPNCDKAWYHKSMALLDLNKENNQLNEALQCCDNAIKIKPTFDDAYFLKAKIWILQKNLDEAMKNIDKALEISPNNEDYFFAMNAILGLLNKEDNRHSPLSKVKRLFRF